MTAELPLVWAGPLLRRLSPQRLVLWLALSQPARLRLDLDCDGEPGRSHLLEPGTAACRLLRPQ